MEDTQRIQLFKEEKELELKKKMDIANKNMIEKEKLYEAIINIKRSPKGKILNKAVKEPDLEPTDL